MFRSMLDPSLTWLSVADLEAWRAEFPEDVRGQWVEVVP